MNFSIARRLLRLEETLFGLPWVMTSAILAWSTDSVLHHSTPWVVWVWLAVAFASARTTGMAFNRVIDASIDAENPRTQDRPIPAGEVSRVQVWGLSVVSAALFVLVCAQINSTVLMLSPIALVLLWAYSYTKRVTPLCHFILGMVQFMGPVFAWAAITGALSPAAMLLGSALLMSIAATDIVYALLDIEFDKGRQLHSMPVLLGTKRAVVVAKGCHIIAFLLLLELGLYMSLNWVYFLGVLLVGCVYVRCYWRLRPEIPDFIHDFLFRCNSRVALVLMVFTIGSVVWQRLS